MNTARAIDHDDVGPRVMVSTWLLTALATVFLGVRVWCKLKSRRLLWWDDYVLILSWVSLVVSVILVHLSVVMGLGKHVYDVPVGNLSYISLLGDVTGTFSILAAVWSKTSFALTLLRLMHGEMRYFLWFLMITVNIAMYLNAIFLWLRCMPVTKTWNPYVEGTCWAPEVYPIFGMCAAGYSAILDFILAMLPWKIIWGLQMRTREKFGVALAMSMGVFAGATAVIKTTAIPTLASGDFTYFSSGLIIWGTAESSVTIMAASIPVLRVLFRDIKSISRRYYISNQENGGTHTSRLVSSNPENKVIISAGAGSLVRKNTSDSEKRIVRDSQGHILQVTELAVEYHNADLDLESQTQPRQGV
ncbi:hypothetical protein GQ53DRAFT_817506 [Thozetella sp. PMI_491]|nr:hypothetical protein GQ53DRAFT_817506 [Thozetella sp. PMI_491]